MESFAEIVNSLALEEYNGVGSRKSGSHKTSCIVRSYGEYSLQAGNVRDKRRPVLRVLCAILGADGNTENDRHSKKACGHGLPFSQLVEYFVA